MRAPRILAVAAVGLTTIVAATSARADSPPDSWSNLRTLTCDGVDVDTALTPGGPGTPYNVIGSTDVLVPVHIEVTFPGSTTPVTTFHVNGFDRNGQATEHCTYVDPAGLFVDLLVVRA